jgi:hypothetical protein
MKTYVLTVSRYFPSYHKRKGDRTFFIEKIKPELELNKELPWPYEGEKIHTIRGNYPLWEKRIEEIQKGNAILSIRYWSGNPYRSKQVEFMKLDKSSSIGLQKLTQPDNFAMAVINNTSVDWETIAKNDGLNFDDFYEWFKNSGSDPMAIIHFTNFRY